MALVNPNIAMSFKPTTEYQPRNALADYAQMQQIQTGQRQAEMADMQMQEYRQNREALGRIQAAIVANGGPPDLEAAANEMIKNPQYMDKGMQILQTLKNQKAMDAYFNPPAAEPMQLSDMRARNRVSENLAPANALAPASIAPVNQLRPNKATIESKIAQLSGIDDPRATAEIKRLERQLIAMEPKIVGGSVYDPVTGQFKTPQKQPSVSGGTRASTGQVVGEPAPKPMTELQQQKVNKERVVEQQGVQAAKSTADELEKLTDELAGNPEKGIPQHPGYSRIVGLESMLPSIKGGNAARAEQKLETFKGKIATLGRQLASQYGKLGNMAVQEWKIVSDSVQNINPGAGNLDEQMRDVVRQARDFERSIQDKYNALYGDQGQQVITPVKPNAKPTGAKPSSGKEDPLGIR